MTDLTEEPPSLLIVTKVSERRFVPFAPRLVEPGAIEEIAYTV